MRLDLRPLTDDQLQTLFLYERAIYKTGMSDRLIACVRECERRRLNFPQLVEFVSEQLQSAREGLERLRHAGISGPLLPFLEQAIAAAEIAEAYKGPAKAKS